MIMETFLEIVLTLLLGGWLLFALIVIMMPRARRDGRDQPEDREDWN